ncbi:MAG: hypothetical protein A2279_09565 [Stygiobacter sp. RIFOXYA12_FULL_38_9]|nr:MAG: hypothetical protein A2X62_11670 [Stygiobacter sp. GWC2_38_9]OGU78721.1 MAG: hypothetical protein A2279_09565 [Stygiobacter sp. RIFOXYA12_FULL_38_9]OGV06158.1 MAG: hypothetical protein A2299_07390 [Stygiobacter sp. RIFOXYB2_FULL_37_11]OGV13119.1 MAG: hypothetical protein A2237_18940 [Stygiobacter sp. RIFOXYA2_FULL_38_8]OGV16982.1 MAG: hypothetical protein A2440_06125 [Stygiobacter sp. RIFOXYC2_FULL_38_25]OGV82954.1 MAG: hypothetical protein A2X65_12030 [Stygiobacter sp. GWF2_38_21]
MQVGAVHSNLTAEVVKITTDKLKLILTQHLSNIEKRKEWLTPLSLLIALLIIFPTTEFKDSLSIKAATWQAFFLMISVLTIIWLIFSSIKAMKAKSVDDLIKLIKSDNN